MTLSSGILHGLHFHRALYRYIYKVKMQEDMFILCLFAKVLVKSLFIGRFSKFKRSTDSQETGIMILIYHHI